MNKWDYVREVSALHAPDRLRGRIAALPVQDHGVRSPRRAIPAKWLSLAAALVLVVGLGAAAPTLIGLFTTGGDITTPPVSTTPSVPTPEGIVAEGIDVPPTILDAAKEYVRERLAWASSHSGVSEFIDGEWQETGTPAAYDNWRIDSLTTVYERKELGEYTVGIYRLDYRLHSTTPERVVLAGPTEVDDEGWVLTTYPASTYLIFLLNYSTNHYFATMINDCSPGSELFDETIKVAIDDYVAGLGGDTAADPMSQKIQGTAIDEMDYAKLEGQMEAGDWAALQEYLPVLREGATFRWAWEEEPEQTVTLEEFYRQRFGHAAANGKLDLERFTLFDFEGVGKQDLILCFDNVAGNYLILHREGQEYYGLELSYRSFQQLQRDGLFVGSGGASYQSYYRMKFQNGAFEEELLGQQIGERYEIGGQEVSAGYFWKWRQNCMVGDMYWYYPAQPTGRKPSPATADEWRWHVSIAGAALESPFLELPEGLRATLEDTGVVEDWSVLWPEQASPWLMKTYRSPSLEVQTLMVPSEMLEELLAEGAFTQEQYDAALGTEYVYTARPLDSSYPTGSGLRLGDSVERARELFYDVPDDGEKRFNAALAVLTVTTENGVVTGLLSSSGGRAVGGIMY